MAKTIRQAEAELIRAALDHADAAVEYRRQWDVNRESDKPRDELGYLTTSLSRGTKAALEVLHARREVFHAAALALRDAINDEAGRRAEAL